jgi:hypothetical protein
MKVWLIYHDFSITLTNLIITGLRFTNFKTLLSLSLIVELGEPQPSYLSVNNVCLKTFQMFQKTLRPWKILRHNHIFLDVWNVLLVYTNMEGVKTHSLFTLMILICFTFHSWLLKLIKNTSRRAWQIWQMHLSIILKFRAHRENVFLFCYSRILIQICKMLTLEHYLLIYMYINQ